MFLGGESLGVLPAGWFPTNAGPSAGASLLFLVTGGDRQLEFSGMKSTGVTEDLTIYYRSSTGSLVPATLRLVAVPDGAFAASVFVPVSTGYVCRIVSSLTRATAMGIATAG